MKNVIGTALIAIGIVLGVLMLAAQPKPVKHPWRMHECGTLDCVTEFLNSLSEPSAVEAKVTTINSQRSFLGVLSPPYYVWYR